jgi:hypothetical protein
VHAYARPLSSKLASLATISSTVVENQVDPRAKTDENGWKTDYVTGLPEKGRSTLAIPMCVAVLRTAKLALSDQDSASRDVAEN